MTTLLIGWIHFHFKGCLVYFFTLILFLIEIPVCKQCRHWSDAKFFGISILGLHYLPRSLPQKNRGPLVHYRSPECWGYVELEQTWKYKSTQCSILLSSSTHTEASGTNLPCHKSGHGQPRVIIWKKPQGNGIQPLGTSSCGILKL